MSPADLGVEEGTLSPSPQILPNASTFGAIESIVILSRCVLRTLKQTLKCTRFNFSWEVVSRHEVGRKIIKMVMEEMEGRKERVKEKREGVET